MKEVIFVFLGVILGICSILLMPIFCPIMIYRTIKDRGSNYPAKTIILSIPSVCFGIYSIAIRLPWIFSKLNDIYDYSIDEYERKKEMDNYMKELKEEICNEL